MQVEGSVISAKEGQPTHAGSYPPAEQAVVRAFLDKVCASAEFARSEQMTRFLRFLVEHRLAGETTVLNERFIGVHVFGKEPGWDPREDTIVRTEARRLRTKIESYYLGMGRVDRVRISLPKGAYQVQIERAEIDPTAETTAALNPVDMSPSPKRRHRMWVLMPVILIACAALAWLRPWHRRAPAEYSGSFEVVPIANELGQEYSPSVSPDGKQIAYVWDGDNLNFDIYVKALAGGAPRRITEDLRPDLYPAWSPDGQSLAYVRKGDELNDILVRPLSGGQERRITQIAMEFGHWADDNSPLLGDPGPAWTRNGKHLIVADVQTHAGKTGLYSVSTETGDRFQITDPPGEMRDFFPRVSPDGSTLAYVRYFTHGVGEIYLLPIDPATGRAAGVARQITFDKQTIRGIGWSAKGKNLFFASNRLGQFQIWSVDLAERKLTLVTTDTSSVADPSQGPLAGQLIFVKTIRNWNIWRAPLISGTMGSPQRLLSSSGETRDPCYSPDGSQIAFVSDRTGEKQIYIASADGTHQRQISDLRGVFTSAPVWSPDGKFVAFDARPEGHAGIYIVPASGGSAKPLNQTAAEERAPFWSRDGRSIYFNSNRTGVVALWKKQLPDGPAVQIAGKDSFLAQETPDGKTLYFSDIHGRLFRSATDGKHMEPLPASVSATPVNSWTPTNHGLYFTVLLSNGRSQIRRYESGETTLVGQTDAPLVVNAKDISVSSDDRFILFAQQDFVGSDIMIRRSSSLP